jgi:hypothetical protein
MRQICEYLNLSTNEGSNQTYRPRNHPRAVQLMHSCTVHVCYVYISTQHRHYLVFNASASALSYLYNVVFIYINKCLIKITIPHRRQTFEWDCIACNMHVMIESNQFFFVYNIFQY